MGGERLAKTVSLAEKVDRLFETAHKRGERELTYREVADAINAEGITTISPNYIWELRTGKSDNPRKAHLEALARFFDVSPVYFYEDEGALNIYKQLELLMSMRDERIRNLAKRAGDLDADGFRILSNMLDQLREVHGLPRSRGGRRNEDQSQEG